MKNVLIFLLLLLGSITAYAKEIPSVQSVEALLELNQYDQAEKDLLDVYSKYPKSEKVNFYLYQVYLRKGNNLKAAAFKGNFESLVSEHQKLVSDKQTKLKEQNTKVIINLIRNFFILVVLSIIGFFAYKHYNTQQLKKKQNVLLNKRFNSLIENTLQIKERLEGIQLLTESSALIKLGYPEDTFHKLLNELNDSLEVYYKEGPVLENIEYGESMLKEYSVIVNKLNKGIS